MKGVRLNMNQLQVFYDFAQKKLNHLFDKIILDEHGKIIIQDGPEVEIILAENDNKYSLNYCSSLFSDKSLSELTAFATNMNTCHSEIFDVFLDRRNNKPVLQVTKIFSCENSDNVQKMGENFALCYLKARQVIIDLLRTALQILYENKGV